LDKKRIALVVISSLTSILILFNYLFFLNILDWNLLLYFVGSTPLSLNVSTFFFVLSSILYYATFGLTIFLLVLGLKLKDKALFLISPLALASYFLSNVLEILARNTSDWSLEDSVLQQIQIEFIGTTIGITSYPLLYSRGIVTFVLLITLVIVTFSIKTKTKHPLHEISLPSTALNITDSPVTSDKTMERGKIMANEVQWKVKLPGQPDQAVDTSTLQMWARSGVIRPDTLILDVNNNMTYAANQIPNVFSSKSYVTALLLSFFLGAIGVDRFYLGQTGLGIAKLLTLGGCGVWALIDFILIAMRKVADSDGNPLA
jgi:TM2 domain-containing membrane protein YozV